MGVELTPGTEWVEPLEWWLLPTSNGSPEPPNNSILGFHEVHTNGILTNLAHRHRQSISGGAGSSSASTNGASNIPDPVFVQVVRRAISEARANPGAFLRSIEDWELEELARNFLGKINPEYLGNFKSIFFEEVIKVLNTIFTSIRNKYEYMTEMVFNSCVW